MSEGVRTCEQCGEWFLFCMPCRLYFPDPLWEDVLRALPTVCPACEEINKDKFGGRDADV